MVIACRELHWSRQKWPNWIILSGIKITSKVDELYCRGLSGLGCGLASLPSGRIWRAPPGEKSPNDFTLTIVSRHLAGPSPPPTPPPLWPSPSFFWQVRAGQIWMTFENHAWENVWEKHWRKKTHFLFVCLYMDLRDACASKMIWSSLWCAIWFMLSWMLLNEHLKGRHLFQFPKTLQLLSFFRLCNMYDYHTMLHFFFISWWVSSIYDVCQWVQTQMNWALNFRRRKQTHTSCICHKLMGKKFCKVEKIRIWIRKLNILLKIS